MLEEGKNDMQSMANCIIKEYESWGLSMSLSKTKYLSIGKNGTHSLIEVARI